MQIHLAGTRPTRRAPAEFVYRNGAAGSHHRHRSSARLASNRVSFEPGARTAWHTHPLGQTLYVISGCGRVQALGGPVREIRPGDVVWIPPGEKHWHGAAPNNAMTHIAMQEALDGSYVTWMEHVTDADYNVAPVCEKSGMRSAITSSARSRCPSTARRARCPIPTIR